MGESIKWNMVESINFNSVLALNLPIFKWDIAPIHSFWNGVQHKIYPFENEISIESIFKYSIFVSKNLSFLHGVSVHWIYPFSRGVHHCIRTNEFTRITCNRSIFKWGIAQFRRSVLLSWCTQSHPNHPVRQEIWSPQMGCSIGEPTSDPYQSHQSPLIWPPIFSWK